MTQQRTTTHTPAGTRIARALTWLCLVAAWLVAVFTVIEEFCMVKACRDTAAFTIFGFNMGIFGVVFFSLLLLARYFERRYAVAEWFLVAGVSAGVGGELRLLWIQKYIIGAWCPLCVSICIALVSGALFLSIEKLMESRTGGMARGHLTGLAAAAVVSALIGLGVAYVGVKALTE